MPMPSLQSLGSRIMICGTSSTGKSTLAAAISAKTALPAVHLDQLRFLPDTDWQERDDGEFESLHDMATMDERWVMEGNYSRLMPQRLKRATGIILLSDLAFANFVRYLRRTLLQRGRVGGLAGDRDSVKWEMIHWVLVRGPKSAARYRQVLAASGLPFIEIRSMREQREAYEAWGLLRPVGQK